MVKMTKVKTKNQDINITIENNLFSKNKNEDFDENKENVSPNNALNGVIIPPVVRQMNEPFL
jgi:hypothetical protein